MSVDLFQKLEHDIINQRDLALVRGTLSGNQNAFAKLMSYYKKRVFNFGKGFFHNETDTEDFVQDVFIKVYTHLESFKGNSMFSTWLMKIAYTTAINSVNRKKDYLAIDDDFEIADKTLTPEDKQIRRCVKEAIKEAVNELPEHYAMCIQLYFTLDLPYQEISDITGFPVNTIKSHIFRAKKILKDKLEGLNE